MPTFSSRARTIVRPNGTSAAPAILKSAIPSGMPMIVRQSAMPLADVEQRQPPPCEHEPQDVPDHAQRLVARRAPHESAPEGPERIPR